MIPLLKRTQFLIAFCLLSGNDAVAADDQKIEPDNPTNSVSGVIADDTLARKAPAAGVVVSDKLWNALLKDWSLKKPFDVDFEKHVVVIATSQGSTVKLTMDLEHDGNLKATVIGTADLQPGFRYVLKRLHRTGIKTFNGKALPKE